MWEFADRLWHISEGRSRGGAWILINRRLEAQTMLMSCFIPYLAIGPAARSATEHSVQWLKKKKKNIQLWIKSSNAYKLQWAVLWCQMSTTRSDSDIRHLLPAAVYFIFRCSALMLLLLIVYGPFSGLFLSQIFAEFVSYLYFHLSRDMCTVFLTLTPAVSPAPLLQPLNTELCGSTQNCRLTCPKYRRRENGFLVQKRNLHGIIKKDFCDSQG